MKSIKLHQHIPLPLIDLAIQATINGKMTSQYANDLAITAGVAKERTRKTANMIRAISLNSPIVPWMLEHKDEFESNYKLDVNHSAIVTAILCSGFAIFYDAVMILGKYLHADDEITGAFLKTKLSELYGSNGNFDRSMSTITRMLVECGILKRLRPGVYAKGESKEISDFTRHLYRQSFLIHNPYASETDNLETHPYFELIN